VRRALPAVAVAAALLAACGGDGGSSQGPVRTDQVDMPVSYEFEPPEIEVEAGTTVTWTNNDQFNHTVHLLDGSGVDEPVAVGDSASITFDDPGTIEYDCSIHPTLMQGKVIVTK
jgi:plastocyanin